MAGMFQGGGLQDEPQAFFDAPGGASAKLRFTRSSGLWAFGSLIVVFLTFPRAAPERFISPLRTSRPQAHRPRAARRKS